MASIVISGNTSGSITLDAPAVSGTTTLTLPTTSGTVVADTATQTLTNKTLTSPTITGAVVSSMASSVITSGTAVASTSGTSIDFTSIPSWVKRITVMFNGVSTNGTSVVQIQLGSTTFSTTGYSSTSSYSTAVASQYLFASTGFVLEPTATAQAAILRFGTYQFSLIGSNTWVGQGNTSTGSVGVVTAACAGGSPALSGTLDRVRITTVNGTDAFDAGTINILYE
jgi:hypothetical protein